MTKIKKVVKLILTEAEINSSMDIEIKFNVHSEEDPKNKKGATYTITYPKKK